MNLVVAVDNEWGIGNKGELLARVKGDLLNFRNITQGKTVVYGYNTLATFPNGKGLKNRKNIVMTRKQDFCGENLTVAHSIEELLQIIEKENIKDVFVIGGESIYRQLLPYCNLAYVTKFLASFEKDAFMPNLDEMSEWSCVESSEAMYSTSETDSVNGMEYRFYVYKRTN